MFGKSVGNLKDILTRNPLEYGDALGLTYGPLSGRAPGKLTDRGLDWQAKVNPGISRGKLESANDIAPFVAAAIGSGGIASSMGDAAGLSSPAVATPSMPAAVPESPATLSSWGMTETSPGVWDATNAPKASPLSGALQRQMAMKSLNGGSRGQPYQPQTFMYGDDSESQQIAALIEALRRASNG